MHGHVVVAVSGALEHGKCPHVFWGQLGSAGQKGKGINWAWNEADRDNVTYAAHDLA
jgi:hypothetical protein